MRFGGSAAAAAAPADDDGGGGGGGGGGAAAAARAWVERARRGCCCCRCTWGSSLILESRRARASIGLLGRLLLLRPARVTSARRLVALLLAMALLLTVALAGDASPRTSRRSMAVTVGMGGVDRWMERSGSARRRRFAGVWPYVCIRPLPPPPTKESSDRVSTLCLHTQRLPFVSTSKPAKDDTLHRSIDGLTD